MDIRIGNNVIIIKERNLDNLYKSLYRWLIDNKIEFEIDKVRKGKTYNFTKDKLE